MFLHQQFEIEVLYSSMLFTSCVSFQPTLNLLHGKPCNAASYSSLESPEVEDQGEEEGGGGGGGRRRKEKNHSPPFPRLPWPVPTLMTAPPGSPSSSQTETGQKASVSHMNRCKVDDNPV